MELLQPYQIINLNPDEYDDYQHQIRRSSQILKLINHITEKEDVILSNILNDGLSATLDFYKSQFAGLTGNEIFQCIHQGITWPKGSAPGPIGVKGSSPLVVLHPSVR